MDDEVKAGLKQAREMPATTRDEKDEVQDFVERILVGARNRSKENRVGNANIRVNTFVKWLRGVPIETLQEELEIQTKRRLREALQVAVTVMDFGSHEDGERECVAHPRWANALSIFAPWRLCVISYEPNGGEARRLSAASFSITARRGQAPIVADLLLSPTHLSSLNL